MSHIDVTPMDDDDDPPTIINCIGTRYWRNAQGEIHRDNDKPAVIRTNGDMVWYTNGLINRGNDNPAITYADGYMVWLINGERHRDNDKPAAIWPDGSEEYWVRADRHRDNDEAAVLYANGFREWWVHGRRQLLPRDRAWSRTDHAKWHGRNGHRIINQYLATFLMGYTWLIDAGGWQKHESVTEDFIELCTWSDLMTARRT